MQLPSSLQLLRAVTAHLESRTDALLIVSPAAAARNSKMLPLGTQPGVKLHSGSEFLSRDACEAGNGRRIDRVAIPAGWEEWPATAPRPGWRDQLPEHLQKIFGDVLGACRDVERPLSNPDSDDTERDSPSVHETRPEEISERSHADQSASCDRTGDEVPGSESDSGQCQEHSRGSDDEGQTFDPAKTVQRRISAAHSLSAATRRGAIDVSGPAAAVHSAVAAGRSSAFV